MPAQAPAPALDVAVQVAPRGQVPAAVLDAARPVQIDCQARPSAGAAALAARHGQDVARPGAAGALPGAACGLLLPRTPCEPRGRADAVQHGHPVCVGAQQASDVFVAVRSSRRVDLDLDCPNGGETASGRREASGDAGRPLEHQGAQEERAGDPAAALLRERRRLVRVAHQAARAGQDCPDDRRADHGRRPRPRRGAAALVAHGPDDTGDARGALQDHLVVGDPAAGEHHPNAHQQVQGALQRRRRGSGRARLDAAQRGRPPCETQRPGGAAARHLCCRGRGREGRLGRSQRVHHASQD